ncbi:MAG: type II 3-dehydroquinate dehydratase [Acidimicrobiia bacterium]|jgi:3-dehydroquinate dehydratase II
MRSVLVVNGPNLNLLGSRQPEIYGTTTLTDLEELVRGWGASLGMSVTTFQSNHEGAIVDALHRARGEVDGVIVNAGALTHYSYALLDALYGIDLPAVEVHISNVHEREHWRRTSVIAPACTATIYGRGVDGYRWALRHLHHRWEWPVVTLAYGSGPDRVADLRLPDGGRAPAGGAVVVHGGFWRHEWTRDTTDGIAVDLARRGLVTWNAEYRRVGAGGGGSDPVDDVIAAVDALRRRIEVDPRRIVLVGHSAGAQLATVAIARLAASGSPPGLVVTLGGVLDLEAAIVDGLDRDAARDYVGTEAVEPLSPLAHVPLGCPVLIAHGHGDDRVPIAYAERFAAAARAAGDEVVEVIGDHGHMEYLDPADRVWPPIADRIIDLMR